MAFCCSCFLAGQTAEKTQTGNMPEVGGSQLLGLIFVLIGAFYKYAIPYSLREPGSSSQQLIDTVRYSLILLGSGTMNASRYIFRGKIAAKYNIQFGLCPDFFFVACCPACSLVQEAKVAINGGVMPVAAATPGVVVGMPVVGQPVGVPQGAPQMDKVAP